MAKLTALQVSNATKRGLLGDGGGLYLKISPTGTKSWVFRYRVAGKLRYHGLGSANTLTLAEARDKALACRKLRLDGIDPIDAKRRQRVADRLDSTKAISFEECAKQYIAAHKSSWKNAKHAWQWENSLAKYAYPEFGNLPVAEVSFQLVLKVLEAIWYDKTETATRLRGRIEAVLEYAKVRGYREGENPARWKGNLAHALPSKNDIMKVEHLKSLAHAEMPAFWHDLAGHAGSAAEALRFTILTAARSGETRGMTWDEVDWERGIWTVPAERMKAGEEHRVPLSPPAVAILEKMRKQRRDDFIFPGLKQGEPLSDNAMLKLLERMGQKGKLTVHGFRSTFRVWCAETTDTPREVAEAVLAHTLTNKVEAAYRRTDFFDKRRPLMDDWATFCNSGL